MNDSIIFAMLWYETMLNKGYRVNNTREEMSTVSKVLDELEDLESRVKRKQKASTGLRAGAQEGYTPKN